MTALEQTMCTPYNPPTMPPKRKKASTPTVTPLELREFRKDRKLTQAQAAKLLGVSFFTWSSWEIGRAKISTANARLFRLLAAGKL